MPEILIEHPDHGRMHVHSESELEAHKKLGWEKLDEEVLLKRIDAKKRINQVVSKHGAR